MTVAGQWIVIPNWDGPDGFQHYRDRDPVWIKNYRTLLHKDEYRQLTFNQRGILHGLWLEYAASGCQIPANTLGLSRRLGWQVTRKSLEALNHAGFIHFSASKPLAQRYQHASPEGEKIKSKRKIGVQDAKPVDNTKDQRHQELFERATTIAGEWNGASSDAFATELDNLERELHARLTHFEREQLWDQALHQP